MSQHSHFYGRQVNYIKIIFFLYTIDYFCSDILNCLYENKISFYIYILFWVFFIYSVCINIELHCDNTFLFLK